MIQYFCALTFLVLITACVHQSPTDVERSPASPSLNMDSGRHIVIAVHGIGGDTTTWGEMGSILKAHLARINPHFSYEFYNFTYPTGKGTADTFDFAHQNLGAFIRDTVFGKNDIRPQDRITFVAHSQGGLVTTIWYVDTLVADEVAAVDAQAQELIPFQKYAQNVDAIITLGTPFWGSKLANRLTDKRHLNPASILGLKNHRELEEMAFGSNTVYQFRRSTIALSRKPELKSQIKARMVNITGLFPLDKNQLYYKNLQGNEDGLKLIKHLLNFAQGYFDRVGFGGDRYESDMAVLAPNSYMKFLYAEDLVGDGKSLKGSDFKEANFFGENLKHIVTESVHAQVSMSYNISMAAIPAYCLQPENCVHPTYRYILKEIAHCQVHRCDRDQSEKIFSALSAANGKADETDGLLEGQLQGFTVDVVLRVPDAQYDLEDPSFKTRPGIDYSEAIASGKEGEQEMSQMWQLSQKKFFKKAISNYTNKDEVVQGTSPLVEIRLGRDTEFLSKFVSWQEMTFHNKSHRDLRLTMTGSLVPTALGKANPEAYQKLIQQGVELPMDLHLPGLAQRQIKILIKPGLSSYVELQMRRASR